jgi:hypothetical protein
VTAVAADVAAGDVDGADVGTSFGEVASDERRDCNSGAGNGSSFAVMALWTTRQWLIIEVKKGPCLLTNDLLAQRVVVI